MRLGSIAASLIGALGGRALGSAVGGNTGGLIGSLAGSMLAGKVGQAAGGGGGLGSLLGGVLGGGAQQQQGATNGGLGGALGSLLGGQGGAAAGAGGLAGALGGLLGGNKSEDNETQSLAAEPVADLDDAHAMVLISAMCSAAKSDGHVDEAEVAAITSRLGDLDEEETAMLRRELSGPVDLDALVAQVPRGFEAHVYSVSLLSIDSVSGAEASYLKELAAALRLTEDETAEIAAAVASATD